MSNKEFIQNLFHKNQYVFEGFPNKLSGEKFIDALFNFLFAPYYDEIKSADDLSKEYHKLEDNLLKLLDGVLKTETERKDVRDNFFAALPDIYLSLLKDADAILQFDPAAKSIEEVFLAYPGFYTIAVYRISHQLLELQVPVLPRLLTEHAHSKTGIDIHPGAQIGEAFAIDHGTGIVIGETTVIGSHVKIYQGVTLGALSVDKSNANKKRHPTIEDNVVIYSGATILGGDTTIGRDSIIGGNVWLTYSVPASSVVYHKSEVKVKDKNPFPEPINFII